MHQTDAPRNRARVAQRLSVESSPRLAARVWQIERALSGYLLAATAQQTLRVASAELVRAVASARGLGRDLRRVAATEHRLAQTLSRLAGAEETGIRRSADARNSQPVGDAAQSARSVAAAHAQADVARLLRRKTKTLPQRQTGIFRYRLVATVLGRGRTQGE